MSPSVRSPQRRGFTLIELLVSMAVMALVLVVLLTITSQVSSMWRYTSGKIEQFRQARESFDLIARRLSQATLNTYWDYDDPANPANYIRQSELRFLSGPTASLAGSAPAGASWPTHGIFFQAPLGISQPGQANVSGLNTLLNTWGYFVEFGSDASFRPSILDGSSVKPRYRFRLCELIQPADAMNIYSYTSGKNAGGLAKNLSYTGRDWFAPAIASSGSTRPVHELAENIIALVVLPKLSAQEDSTGTRLATDYFYDSTDEKADPTINPKNQLPPVVQVTLVAIDDTAAKRLESGSNMPSLGLDTLFKDAASYESDLKTLEKTLTDARLNYRVFTTSVRLKEARWSNEQKN